MHVKNDWAFDAVAFYDRTLGKQQFVHLCILEMRLENQMGEDKRHVETRVAPMRDFPVDHRHSCVVDQQVLWAVVARSEEHTSELQSLMRISYAVFCLKKKQSNKHLTTYDE